MSTHDYTSRGWGHDFCIRDVIKGGRVLKASGWGNGIEKGDFIIIPNSNPPPGANDSTRYRVKEISYCSDPRDMWHATLTFAPRSTSQPASA